jgi:hypothetical protein
MTAQELHEQHQQRLDAAHQQLLDAVHAADAGTWVRSLTAVIRLHSPIASHGNEICSECVVDGGCAGVESMRWPCPTIDATTAP